MHPLKWVLLAVAVGIIGGQVALDLIFPEFVVTEGCCKGWKPCPGRKPERIHGRKYVWWCGPDVPGAAR